MAATLHVYEKGTGRTLSSPPTPTELRAVRNWLLEQEDSLPRNELGHSVALLSLKKQYTKPLIFPDAVQKASWLQQAPCLTCIPDDSRTPLAVSFAIRTRPFSAQSLSAEDLRTVKRKVTERVQSRLLQSNDWGNLPLCVRVVAVVGQSDPSKDIDNMVKGILDALQGSIYRNDGHISHLSIDRFRHAGHEGCYLLSVRPVREALADVIDPEVIVGWGAPEITT